MINTYYLMKDGEETGPFTLYELMDMSLTWDSQVLSPLTPEWQNAADLPELNQYFQRKGIYFPTLDNLANFWWRLLAYMIDSFFLGSLIILICVAYRPLLSIVNNIQENVEARLIFDLYTFALYVVYNTICESTALQGSLGKRILNMVVVDANGARLSFANALGRNVSKLLSSLVCCVGYAMVLWDEHRQAWHDKIAKTYVVKKM